MAKFIVINIKLSHGIVLKLYFYDSALAKECFFMNSPDTLVKQMMTFFNYRTLITIGAFFPMLANATIADENFTQCKVNLAERAKIAGFSTYITQTVIDNISPN
jgi:hypothetical protein